MKILFVSNLFPPAYIGGYEMACRDTVDLLASAGHECHVLTSDFRSQILEAGFEKIPGRIERTMKLHHSWGGTYHFESFETVQQHNLVQLREAIARVRPEVVYLWNLYGLGWRLLRALEKEAPPATFHFMDWSIMAYQSTFKRVASSLWRRVPLIWCNVRPKIQNAIFISRFTRQQLDLSPTYSSVIYPYLSSEGVPEKNEYRLGKVIRTVFIGQIEQHKGIFFLCEALKAYRKSSGHDIRLDVYGLSRTGKDMALREQFGDFVSVMTNVERSSLLQNLSTYDVGFFPSIWEEPFGIAQIEMMQAGLPVISTGRGGSAEVFNGHNLLFYEYDNQSALNAVLHELLMRYDKVAPKLGAQARQQVLHNHSSEHYRLAIESHLRQVALSGGG